MSKVIHAEGITERKSVNSDFISVNGHLRQ